jgi:chromosomal replication initiation ATPase DnaA
VRAISSNERRAPADRCAVTPSEIIEALDARGLIDHLDVVCRTKKVTREEVCSRVRTKTIAAARHELWWRLRTAPELELSYDEIGRLFDRNHTSVLHGVRAHQRREAAASRAGRAGASLAWRMAG